VTSHGRPRVWPVFVGFAAVVVVLQVVATLVLGAWAYLTLPLRGGTNDFVARLEALIASPSGLTVLAVLSAIALGASALLAAAVSPVHWRARLRLSAAGITPARVALVVAGTLAVSYALDACVGLSGLSRFGALHQINQVMARASGGWLVVLAFAVALAPGVAEETFFRGYMQTRLAQRFGPALAIAVTAACFGLLHFDLLHTPVAAVLGVFLGWAAERTRSIVPGMAAHVTNNLVALVTARWVSPSSRPVLVGLLIAALLAVAGVVLALQRAYRGTRLDVRAPEVAASIP